MKKLLLAALLALPPLAAAQYPAKPIRAVVAFGTGGTTDVTARIIAAALSQSLGQPVVIDNKPGADGIIAGSEVVKSAPDGYTIFFGTYTQVSALPSLRQNVPFDPLVDLTPIGNIGNFTFFWAVNPELPIKNMKDLAAYGRANPGKLNAGSSGTAGLRWLPSVARPRARPSRTCCASVPLISISWIRPLTRSFSAVVSLL